MSIVYWISRGRSATRVLLENDFVELDSMLLADHESRSRYLDYCRMHVALRLELRAHRAAQKAAPTDQHRVDRSGSKRIRRCKVVPPSAMPLGFLATTFHGTVGYFSSGWPVAYLVATVIFGIGLLIGSLMPVSQPAQVAKQSVASPAARSVLAEDGVVGRITGMVDCQWTDLQISGRSIAIPPSRLGGKYRLGLRLDGNHLRYRGQGHSSGPGHL